MKGKNKTKLLLGILGGALVIIIAAVAFLLVNGQMKEKHYSEAISSAEKYLVANNYEDAIIQYKKAISVNPKNEEAYLSLADVYVEKEETSKAKSILRKGYKETDSFKLKRMLDSLEAQMLVATMDGTGKEQKPELDLNIASQNIAWDTSFVQKITSFDFEDYKDKFGIVQKVQMNEEGYMEVVHSGFDGVCYYRNTGDNKDIIDVSRNTPKAEGMPEKITLNSLNSIFRNFDGGVNLSRLQMFFGEKVTPKTLENQYYVETELEGCIVRIGTDVDGNIVSPNAWNEIILTAANQEKSHPGRLSGVIVDAVTGEGVEGAELTFVPSKRGLKEKKTGTDQAGIFSVELEPDVYTIVISAEEYIEEEFSFKIEQGKSYNGEQFNISPKLTKGTARIVLEWNAEPRDLDSYLVGDNDDGVDVNVNFFNKQAFAGDKVIAELDLDDTNGYGPETTTIYDLNGVYRFTVADFKQTGTMKQYGATVKVYLPGKEAVTISIDSGANVVDIWNVCEIDHGELNIINSAPDEDEFTDSNK